MLLNRDFLNIALPIPDGVQFHDVWFSFLACFINGLKNIDECITLYRQHENNSSGTHLNSVNKISIFKWHLFSKGNLNYRHLLLKPIKERIQLDEKQLEFVNRAEVYCKNRFNTKGRINNAIFEIMNFKLIYGTKKSFHQYLFIYIIDKLKNKLKFLSH